MMVKKQGKDEEEQVDPRLTNLKEILNTSHTERKKEERQKAKLLRPLKRVNSKPIILLTQPACRNLFPDSRSVDFGFDGTLDIPNQTFYLDEMPDTKPTDFPKPDKNAKGMESLDFLTSSTTDKKDLASLDKVESTASVDFLKTRIGTAAFDNLLQEMEPPFGNLPERKETAGRRIWTCIAITALLLILIVAFLGGLTLAGVRVPFLADAFSDWFPKEYEVAEAIYDPQITAGEGIKSGEFTNVGKWELYIMGLDVYSVSGEKVDMTARFEDYEAAWPFLEKVQKVFTDVFEYMGYKVDIVIPDYYTVRHSPDRYEMQVRLAGPPRFNVDLMWWYGYNETSETTYTKHTQGLLEQLTQEQHDTEIKMLRSYVSDVFIKGAKKYYGRLEVRRPPDHIPDKWGECTGSPVCP